MNDCSQFGKLIRMERERRNIQLWRFAASIPFPQSNVQRIETGLTEPRIGLAVRMVNALELDVGQIMEGVVQAQDWGASPAGLRSPPPNAETEMISEISPDISDSPAMLFGHLFRNVRLMNGLTQTNVAEYAGYTVRSLISVEKGKQEPALMTALRLVWASGFDISTFFNKFSKIMNNTE